MTSDSGFDAGAASGRYPVTMGAAAPDYSRREAAVEDHSTFSTQNESNLVNSNTSVRQRPFQPSLFSRSEPQKVVSIAPDLPAATTKREHSKRSPAQRRQNEVSSQQQLIFTQPELEGRRQNNTSVEAYIYCSDPVASIIHRVLATVGDLVLISIAVGLFAIAFYLAGGEIEVSRQTVLVYASIPLIIAAFYKYLWAIAGADSPGMVWSGLRTVNFDGKKPEIVQRFLRLGGGFLGVAAVGIGLVWAFVDEETLTWHDHISNTFTTPV
jgi:uncharacterized RDD family membrane protein YckC